MVKGEATQIASWLITQMILYNILIKLWCAPSISQITLILSLGQTHMEKMVVLQETSTSNEISYLYLPILLPDLPPHKRISMAVIHTTKVIQN
jgi:hypothetical protein